MFRCSTGCCTIQIYEQKWRRFIYRKRSKKAGVFIFDPEQERVLLVRSRGFLYGAPKGTIETDESCIDCAIREVKEETGLIVNESDFKKGVKIKNRAIYYYAEMKTTNVQPEDRPDNDVNAITWIKISCLEEFIKNGIVTLNQDCKLLFKKFLDKIFCRSEFTKVRNRKSKSLSKKRNLEEYKIN
jgi:ADP-ribose pyrophosphatase YjhB (NUDIX family)